MAELEKDVETNNELEDTNEDYQENDNQEEDQEFDYNQALEWKKKAERLDKAEKKLVELKKQAKTKPNETPEGEYITKKELEIEKFITKNPELEEYRSDLETYTNKGLSLQEAKTLLENSDKVFQNRRKTDEINITATDGEPSKKAFTKDAIAKMSQSEYNRFMDLKAEGKVKVV